MKALLAGLLLAVELVFQIVASGAVTAWTIVAPGARPKAGILPMPYEGLSEAGAAVLASMIAVTPGTTPVDIDHVKREMRVHFLDVSRAEASIESIRSRYEPRLRVIFPEKEGRRG